MNMSLKSARPESSTYSTSSRMASAAARSRSDRAAIFEPSPATLPAETIRVSGSFGTRPMRTALAGREVGAEAAREQHLGDIVGGDAELAHEDHPAGRDRGLRELQLAHVALGEVDRVLGLLAAPGEHEHALLAHLDEPLGEHRVRLGGGLVGDEAAGVVEQAARDQLGDGVDEPRAAHADRVGVADHLEA